MKIIRRYNKELEKIYTRNLSRKKQLHERVLKIVEDVRINGDEALVKYTRKFDRVKLLPKQFKVSELEISGAYQNINPGFVNNLRIIIQNIETFYRKQLRRSWKLKCQDGVELGEKIQPHDTVAIYIPAGTAPLVSTVYMTAVPAKIAGVKRIVILTPPNDHGDINPHILVVADLLKVNEIYKVGGAQAIAAAAFGTKTIPRADKIVGPGNAYVTEAKRQLFGYVDIDMLAGPTELVIIANRHSNAKFVIADLESQEEHSGGMSILITTSKDLAKEVAGSASHCNGAIILVKNLEEAAEIANRIAPEHLEIMVQNPKKVAKLIRNAGAVFLGPFSPVSVGDYVAGPSHVLPTGGSARFFSGLSLNDFVKSIHVISYSRKALEAIRGPLEAVAGIEKLEKHVAAVRVRFE